MEYVPGIKINRIQQLDKLGVDRKRYVLYTSQPWPQFSVPTDIGCFWLTWITSRLGRYAVESYLEQILSHGFFHADPVSRSVHPPHTLLWSLLLLLTFTSSFTSFLFMHWPVKSCIIEFMRSLLSGIDPSVPARKEEDGLLLGFLCNPTGTHILLWLLPCNLLVIPTPWSI